MVHCAERLSPNTAMASIADFDNTDGSQRQGFSYSAIFCILSLYLTELFSEEGAVGWSALQRCHSAGRICATVAQVLSTIRLRLQPLPLSQDACSSNRMVISSRSRGYITKVLYCTSSLLLQSKGMA